MFSDSDVSSDLLPPAHGGLGRVSAPGGLNDVLYRQAIMRDEHTRPREQGR